MKRDLTEQTARQDALTLRMGLAVENNATVLTKTVITSADVCDQQKVIHREYIYHLVDLSRLILLQTPIKIISQEQKWVLFDTQTDCLFF